MEKNKAVNKKNELTIYQKLQLIQTSLKCPKTRTNNFAKYKYRNAEDILNAIKPFQQQLDFVLTTPTENINDQGYIYVQCTAILTCSKTEKQIRVFGQAGVELNKKGQSSEQQSGSAISYAKKYALDNLFGLDDTADSDTTNDHGILKQKISTTINNTIAETNQKKSVTSKKVAGNGSVKIEKFVIDENSIKKIKTPTDAKKALTSNKVIFSNETIKNELIETFNLK